MLCLQIFAVFQEFQQQIPNYYKPPPVPEEGLEKYVSNNLDRAKSKGVLWGDVSDTTRSLLSRALTPPSWW